MCVCVRVRVRVRVRACMQVDSLSFDTLRGPDGELYSLRLLSAAQPKPVLSVLLAYDLEVVSRSHRSVMTRITDPAQ